MFKNLDSFHVVLMYIALYFIFLMAHAFSN